MALNAFLERLFLFFSNLVVCITERFVPRRKVNRPQEEFLVSSGRTLHPISTAVSDLVDMFPLVYTFRTVWWSEPTRYSSGLTSRPQLS